MRLRKVKNALEKLKQHADYFIDEPINLKGKWQKVFNNENPVHIEIGCGKGQFIIELCKQNPNINFIAIEKYDSVLLRVAEKLENLKLNNLKITILDAFKINDYFANGEVSRIYLNFSDPWPKNAHAKRRLTSPVFLKQYKVILSKDGEIHQKTDNRGLFEYSLQMYSECNWGIKNISLNLHADKDKYSDNIMTEFEEKWSKLGPIYRVEAYKK